KNNLQVVSSLLGLQSIHVKDEQARRMFKQSQDRVKSIALVHEKCYHSPNLERLAFADYIRALVLNLFHSYGVDSGRLTFQLRADNVSLNLDTAIPCALIINELVSNSLKHAFPCGKAGTISIDLRPDAQSRLTLAVRDNGIGFSPAVDIRNTNSLGLQL